MICCISTFILALALIGTGIADIMLYVKLPTSNIDCPEINNYTSFQIQKQVHSRVDWNTNWRVRHNDEYIGDVQMQCPTWHKGAVFMIDGVTYATLSGDLFDTSHVVTVCGNDLFRVKRGPVYRFLDSSDKLIGYLSDSAVYNEFDQTIAMLTETTLRWSINIFNETHPLADPMILSMIVGFASFKEYDVCNHFFWSVMYAWMGVVALLLFVIVMTLFIVIRRKRMGRKMCGNTTQHITSSAHQDL